MDALKVGGGDMMRVGRAPINVRKFRMR